MHAQSELAVSKDSDGSSRESRDRAPPPSPSVVAAAEVLSAPRKWPKGSGRGPFKRQPRPLGAPPPAPAGRARLGWWWEPRAANRRDGADGLARRTLAGVGSCG